MKLFMWVVMFSLPTSSLAASVIYNNTYAKSLVPLYSALQGNSANPIQYYNGPATITLAQRLPVQPRLISPGKHFKSTHGQLGIGQPLFIIGADSFSIEWLARHKQQLQQLNAIGIIVQAKTTKEVAQITSIGSGLRYQVLLVDEFMGKLGIKHYPVLITTSHIEQ